LLKALSYGVTAIEAAASSPSFPHP
jgi:hypothetical protein